MPLAELSRIVYFRGDTLPPDLPRELMQTRHFITKQYPFAFTNGVQACWLEVDVDTGLVKLLKHWCVEDCGRIINPLLVDEQVRGGIVQGLGGALYEHCIYSPEGQLMIGSMADYLVPMAAEMPDIEVGHVETPTKEVAAGRQGRGRGRHRGRACRRHERHQRRLATLRRQGVRPALHAGTHSRRPRQGPLALADCGTRYGHPRLRRASTLAPAVAPSDEATGGKAPGFLGKMFGRGKGSA